MENKKLPTILVTNDDSIYAKGIKELIEVAREIGNVIVVAPDKIQSAKGHAVTLDSPIYVHKTREEQNFVAYKCSGTPADCVKIAIHEIMPQKPDIILSGINHGSNSSVNVLYSGTMAAALEGTMNGVPSIGLSLLSYDNNADFTAAKHFAKKIILSALENKLPHNVCLNVNFPYLKTEEIKGVKICRQTNGKWAESFEKRHHPRGLDYFWLTGQYSNLEPGATDTDIFALENGYVAVVPLKIDMTDHLFLQNMQNWNF